MVAREFGWSRLVGGLLIGFGAMMAGGSAFAGTGYVGDSICSVCHEDKYETYKRHGHPWMELATERQAPVDGKFPSWDGKYPSGAEVSPTIRDVNLYSADGKSVTRKLGWSDVVSMFGGFENGDGYYLIDPVDMPWLSGRYVGHSTSQLTVKPTSGAFPFRCFNCHNTGGSPSGHQYGVAGLAGSAALSGIQCEQCHGKAGNMSIPDKQICRDCHSSTDAAVKPIPFDAVNRWFGDRHAQGDEYRRSPHKDKGCVICHDPHKSAVLEEGGVKYAEDEGAGNMCKKCHDKQIRGAMGDIGLECVDCHMPKLTEMGALTTHLFKITTQPLTADENVHDAINSSGSHYLELNTDANGDSFLTLDLVCVNCHSNMSMEQLSKGAKGVHRQPGLVDLTVNGFDLMRVVKTTDKVAVKFSVDCEDQKGKKATWYVLCQGPRGWTYWDGKAWKTGNKPWRKGIALANIAGQTVLNGKLTTKGFYTYWVSITASDGKQYVDSVPVLVK